MPNAAIRQLPDLGSWPAEGLDPYRLAVQTQVIRVVAMVAAKVEERRPDPEVAELFRRLMEESKGRKAMEEEAEA